MVSHKDAKLYAVHEVHLDDIEAMLKSLSLGDKIECFKTLQKVVREGLYGSGCITQSLAMEALRGPQHFGHTFNSDQWSELIDDIGECSDYYQVVAWIDKYGSAASARLGGF